MSEYSNDSYKQSKFSTGLSQVYRLDELTKDMHRHSRDRDYLKWNEDLDRLWSELAPELEDTDEKIKEFNKHNKVLESLGLHLNLIPQGFKSPSPLVHSIRAKQYKALMNKELFIRKLQNDLGKGSSYEDELEDVID